MTWNPPSLQTLATGRCNQLVTGLDAAVTNLLSAINPFDRCIRDFKVRHLSF